MNRFLCILIAVLLGINNVFINFKIGGISYDRLIEIGLLLLLFKDFARSVSANKWYRTLIIFTSLFFVLELLTDLKLALTAGIQTEKVVRDCAKFISFTSFSYLFYFIARKDIRYLSIILVLNFGSFVFAGLQHPKSPYSKKIYEIRQKLFSSVTQEDILENFETEAEYIDDNIVERFRVSGPFSTPITLAYLLLSSFFLTLYMFVKRRKKIFLVNSVFIVFISLLSQTRSVLLAEIMLLAFVGFFSKNIKYRTLFRSLTFITLCLFLVKNINSAISTESTSADPKTRLLKFNDQGADRPMLWLTGVYAVATHPFGISEKQYMESKKEMYILFKSPSILIDEAHNGFINLGLQFTILGYPLFIFFAFFLVNLTKNLPHDTKILFRGFFIAYIVHSSFHNNFIFYSDYDVLMIVTLLCLEAHGSEAINPINRRSWLPLVTVSLETS